MFEAFQDRRLAEKPQWQIRMEAKLASQKTTADTTLHGYNYRKELTSEAGESTDAAK